MTSKTLFECTLRVYEDDIPESEIFPPDLRSYDTEKRLKRFRDSLPMMGIESARCHAEMAWSLMKLSSPRPGRGTQTPGETMTEQKLRITRDAIRVLQAIESQLETQRLHEPSPKE